LRKKILTLKRALEEQLSEKQQTKAHQEEEEG